MLPRSTLPNFPEKSFRPGLPSLLSGSRSNNPSILFIVAHPGDEIVAAAGALKTLKNVTFLHVTDGAPRDLTTAFEAGFADRLEFAEARNREFLAALQCAGFGTESRLQLGYPAGEISRNLAPVTMELVDILGERRPDAIVTHAFEGRNSDHDAIAFAVQTACALIDYHGEHPPLRIEAAGFSDDHGDQLAMVGHFLSETDTQSVQVELSSDELRFKQLLLERMPMRLSLLKRLPLGVETFRVAPTYDFAHRLSPDSEDVSSAGLKARRWRRVADDALRVLGLGG